MSLSDTLDYDPWEGVFEAHPAASSNGTVPQGEDEESHSWRPMDIESVIAGDRVRPEPTVGARTDGAPVLYEGKVHTISGESESGKTWFSVAVICEELSNGRGAGVIDFEDDEIGWVGRLLDAGAHPDSLRELFFYIRPDEPLGSVNRKDLKDALDRFQPSVVILDGITEAMTLHGLDPLKNAEVAMFGKALPRWVARQGPAVLCTDHVVKDKEGRGRYALGAVHKLNGLDGAAFILENRTPFGFERKGESTVSLAKDRPGRLRAAAKARGKGQLDWFADLVVVSRSGEPLDVALFAPPVEVARPSGQTLATRPTALMGAASEVLRAAGGAMSMRQIIARMAGRRETRILAVELLVEEGFVAAVPGPRNSTLHTHVRAFGEEEES